MHNLMLVTLTNHTGRDSLAARVQARFRLSEDDSFCGDGGGRFTAPLCDWFTIGGRWSGLLQEAKFGDAYRTALKLRFPETAAGAFPARWVKKHAAQLNQLWAEFGGSAPAPLLRDTDSADLGHDDDAMPVDAHLYDRFLAPYEGQSLGPFTFADLNDEPVDRTFIGRKWLVVVDYHC